MHAERTKPGKTTLVAAEDSSPHNGPAVGKQPLVPAVATAASNRDPADHPHTQQEYHDDVQENLRTVATQWQITINNRQNAVNKFDREAEKGKPADKHAGKGIVGTLAQAALALAGDTIEARIAKIAGESAVKFAHAILKAGHPQKIEDSRATTLADFTQLQTDKLIKAAGAVNTKSGQLIENKLGLLNHHNREKAFRDSKALIKAMKDVTDEAFQIQYDTTAAKWFDALAQSSFGTDRHGGANLAGHLPHDQGDLSVHNALGDKKGMVMMTITLDHAGDLAVGPVQSEGIPESVWGYDNPDFPGKALGDIPLEKLPHHVHIPVIANIIMSLDTKDVTQHFTPAAVPEAQRQKLSISWNDRGRVDLAIPTSGLKGEKYDRGDEQWVRREFAAAMQRGGADSGKDADKAARYLMHTRIGKQTLRELVIERKLAKP